LRLSKKSNFHPVDRQTISSYIHENLRMPVSGIAKKDASKPRASHTQRSSDGLEPLMILTAFYLHQQEERRKQKLLLLRLLLEEEEEEEWE
jgi:hypothetical protein